MNIRPFEIQDTKQVVALWNEEATKYDYKLFTEETFTSTFIQQRYFDANCIWVGYNDSGILAFAAGCTGEDLPLGDVAGYITIAIGQSQVGDKEYHELVERIEQRFVELGKKQAEVLFFNPVKLIWNMPSQPQHEHNNAPGIDPKLPLYRILRERGYNDRATQCGMYLPLGGFNIPEDIIAKEHKANASGYSVTLYDSEMHTGLDEMLQALNNEQWRREVSAFANEGIPVVIAVKEKVCVGFAGPIIREQNGRAFFCGIGVRPEDEGHGLGSVLFFKMVEAFQSANCHYITLFTGLNNPAIRIYQKAGFQIEKQFSILRKEF